MRYFSLLILLCFLLGCEDSKQPNKPENLISEATMEDILYDSFILNATKASKRKILEENGIYPKDFLFEKYNIDSAQFSQSNAYYAYNTELYTSIIENVKSRLSNEKDKYTEQLKEEKRLEKKRTDSIKNARKRVNDSLKKTGKKGKMKLEALKPRKQD